MSNDDQWGAGERAKWSSHGTVMVGSDRYPLIYGEHPHSRSDDRHYVEMEPGEEPVGFSGHRILIDVQLTSSNYLKDSHYSGGDIRKGGSGVILADGVEVWEFFFRDVQSALLKAHQLIAELSEHASGWLMQDKRARLVGRKVFYREIPAVIDRLITDQGCVIIRTEDGKPFPAPVWREGPEDDDGESTVKAEVTDPKIWWFRQ